MTAPLPPEGAVRYHETRTGEPVYEVFRNGAWKRLTDQEQITAALQAAPVTIPGKSQKNPGGERIWLPPPEQ